MLPSPDPVSSITNSAMTQMSPLLLKSPQRRLFILVSMLPFSPTTTVVCTPMATAQSIVNELRVAEIPAPYAPTAPRGTSASLSPFQKALLAIHRPDLGLSAEFHKMVKAVEIEDEDENELQEGGHAGQEPEPDGGSQYDPQFDMDDPLSYYIYEEHGEDEDVDFYL